MCHTSTKTRRGEQLVPIGLDCQQSVENRPSNAFKMLSVRKSSTLRISPSLYSFEEAVCLLTK